MHAKTKMNNGLARKGKSLEWTKLQVEGDGGPWRQVWLAQASLPHFPAASVYP